MTMNFLIEVKCFFFISEIPSFPFSFYLILNNLVVPNSFYKQTDNILQPDIES